MIQVTYTIPFTSCRNLASQLAEAQNAPLNQGELEFLGLTQASDNTTWGGATIDRVVQFNETPAFIQNVGLPFSDAKRKAMVKNLFTNKLTLSLKKAVSETIVLM